MIEHPDYLLIRSQPWWLKWPVGLYAMSVFWQAYQDLSSGWTGGVVQAEFILTLIYLIIVLIAQEVLRPKQEFEDARPKGDGDFHFVTATEGRPVPIVWGRIPVLGPNCIWYGDISAIAITETVKTGWFSKETFISGYEYTLGVQFGLCRGPGVELVRVWLGRELKHLVFDGTVSGILSLDGDRFDIDEPELHFPTDGGVQGTCDFYTGSLTQLPNDYLKTAERQLQSPMTEVPRYSGTSYVLFRELTGAAPDDEDGGGYVGNSSNVDPWAFEVQRFPPIFSGQGAGEHLVPASSGIDCNPMNVVFEILTDKEWGLGFLPGEIGVGVGSSFLSAADTLATEINGFSFILDRQIATVELLGELERQIDGIVFLSQSTGKWEVKLARADYNVATIPHFTENNSTFTDYARSTWEDTTNQLTVKFNKRSDDYKESYAVAQDSANIIMQGGGSVATGKIVAGSIAYPGCKLNALASTLVWRSLRTRAFPISRAKFQVDRSFWQLSPGDVFKWTNDEMNISERVMRITSIDFGKLSDNKISIQAVQDIFEFLPPSFGEVPDSSHIEPAQNVSAIPVDEQTIFEAPRAMLTRDLDYANDDLISKVYCGARRQGPEVITNITERHSSGTPSGAFSPSGKIASFIHIGSLKANLNSGFANPTSSITIEAGPSSQTLIEAEFFDATTTADLGTRLNQMILINGEVMLVKSASLNGLDIDMETVYRGALDTAQETHTAGDDVFLFSFGGVLADTSFENTDNVHIRLLPQSMRATLASGSANQVDLTMAKRALRPYTPAAIHYNGGTTDYDTPDLEGDGAGLNGFGIDVDWLRRAFNPNNEVTALGGDVDPDVDTGTIISGPVANTEYELEVRHSPYGVSDVVETRSFAAGTGIASILLRTNLLANMPNTALADLEFRITARHDYNGETQIESRTALAHRVTLTSTLTGQVAMGQSAASTELPVPYVATTTNTHTLTLGSSFTVGNVEYRLNGGSWVNLITAGGTSGGFAPSVSDSIEFRHTASDGAQQNFLQFDDNGTPVAYGIMTT